MNRRFDAITYNSKPQGNYVNKSIADIAHDIIARVNENNLQIDAIRERIRPIKNGIKDNIDSILLAKMCMDACDVINELATISARVSRQGAELRNLTNIVDIMKSAENNKPQETP